MGGEALPRETRDAIIARADGVPLFVEKELTKRSGDRQDIHTVVIARSLMARLDRIPRSKPSLNRRLHRTGVRSTCCRKSPIWTRTLHAALNQLTATELIFRRGPAANRQYMFKHAGA